MRNFGPETQLSRSQQLLSTELDQETVLMSIQAGAYYGLADTARSVWEILERPMTFATLVDRMVLRYRVTPENCAADLQGFLTRMEREGLLRVD